MDASMKSKGVKEAMAASAGEIKQPPRMEAIHNEGVTTTGQGQIQALLSAIRYLGLQNPYQYFCAIGWVSS